MQRHQSKAITHTCTLRSKSSISYKMFTQFLWCLVVFCLSFFSGLLCFLLSWLLHWHWGKGMVASNTRNTQYIFNLKQHAFLLEKILPKSLRMDIFNKPNYVFKIYKMITPNIFDHRTNQYCGSHCRNKFYHGTTSTYSCINFKSSISYICI